MEIGRQRPKHDVERQLFDPLFILRDFGLNGTSRSDREIRLVRVGRVEVHMARLRGIPLALGRNSSFNRLVAMEEVGHENSYIRDGASFQMFVRNSMSC